MPRFEESIGREKTKEEKIIEVILSSYLKEADVSFEYVAHLIYEKLQGEKENDSK